ncbi:MULTISPECIES: winged helix-turn-helix domain-containing protein [Haloferax]|uniref:Helix-turn-helix domain-containing protein n=1 Tax=Haloferax marinum TaxID=2666143 RepID=A0A6A8G3S5_9EURY|nr:MULTISPECIES: winged helix-turn-helix domain-containing protein [Haloferax]KAB1196420.1 winged helix-turn-helix transcriptional regulator [Haloferax sp. CBA1150]MRW95415.1 helix-turn-helix domain-containing protein [Haloferax marinum]
MSGLLPSEGNVDTGGEASPRVHWLEDEETEQLIACLSCDTARDILSCLHDSPATATELAELVDTSIQNVRHHLGNLVDADLVRIAGTRYSEKGREMKVYAPTDGPLVVCVGGDERDREGVADAISSFLE